jgi:kumamolisin
MVSVGVRLRWVTWIAAAAATAALTLLASSAPALAAPAASGPLTTVAQGVNPAAIPGTKVFGKTPASTPETVSFVLRAQHLNALQAAVVGGARHFLTVNQFANIYGQNPGTIAAIESYLASFGIQTQAYADRLDIVANGTAGQFNKALDVLQQQYSVPAFKGHGGLRGARAQTVHGAPQSPRMPSSVANPVLAILGLSNYSPFISQSAHVSSRVVQPKAGNADACIALTGLPKACNTPADYASDYNLNGLYRRGADGQGRTLAIVTLAAVDPGAPQFFWKNIAGLTPSGRTLTVQNVDGGPGAPSDDSGSGETDLDLEQSGSLASGANVIDYQAPNSDPGFFDAFASAASQNVADTVSTSWGESEQVIEEGVASGTEPRAYTQAFDEVFLELAAQGQSAFDSAGDEAAYDDYDEMGTTELSVDNPADSPYITAAGGTTLPFSGSFSGPDGTAPVSVSAQRIWGWDYTWIPEAKVLGEPLVQVAEDPAIGVGGTGGGFSRFESQPAYQRGVPGTNVFSAVPYFTPTDVQDIGSGVFLPTMFNFNRHPPTVRGFDTGRALPDMSSNADPITGYLLYEPSFATAKPAQPVLQGGWGGTSFSSPQMNGSTSVIDSFVGHRVGFLDPSIYSFATSHASPFTPLNTPGTSNDNLFYTGTPGTLFNPGGGLGMPDYTQMGKDFASQP